MKINFLLTALTAAILSSCSTSYKTGQTPDDVYYSPVRLQNNEVRREDDNRNVYDNSTVYDSPIYTPYEEREIRRRINSRRYRRNYDRYNYPYGYNNYPPVYGNPKTGTTTKPQQPRTTNLGGYSNSTSPDSANYNPKTGKFNTGSTTSPVRTFGTPKNSSSNNGSGVGNAIRRIFSGDNSYNNSSSNNNYNNGNSNNSPSRTFESRSNNNNTQSNSNSSSTSSSSSGSSSSGTSAPVRTFKKD